MFGQIAPALRMLAMLTLLTGVAYPFLMTGLAQVAFPHAANGSLIVVDGKTMGSDLIGQPFDDPKYFWSRPSATSPQPYNAAASSGSNLGPRNPALADAVKDRVKALQRRGSRQHAAGARRPRHVLGQRARSGHQHGVRLLSSRARRCRARPARRGGKDARGPAHERPHLRRAGRAARQRGGAQPRSRPAAEVAPSGRPRLLQALPDRGARSCGAPPGKL